MRLHAAAESMRAFEAAGHDADAPVGDALASAFVAAAPRTSFIRRCWFDERGCGESSTCGDMRKLFDHAEHVKVLPKAAACKNPTYIVSGSRYKHGFMEGKDLSTLAFNGETWHKCCFTGGDAEGKHMKMVCEKMEVFPNTDVVGKLHGYCGGHFCLGDRHRCLVVDKVVDKQFKTERKGLCPFSCPSDCVHITHKFECINIGPEAGPGKEGTEKVKRPDSDMKEGYKVFSYGPPAAPLAAALLPPPSAQARGGRRVRRTVACNRRMQQCERFLT